MSAARRPGSGRRWWLAKASDDWRLLQHLADAAVPGLRQAVVRIFEDVGARLPVADVAAFLQAGDTAGAEDLIQRLWDEVGAQGLQSAVAPRLEALAASAAGALPAGVEVGVRFNVADPEALATIARVIGDQITAIDAATREAVRGIIERAFASGTPLYQQAQEIGDLVGLTSRQAEALARFRQGLVDAGEAPNRVQDLVARQAAAAQLQRGEMIARTESMVAANTGQQVRWEQAVSEGILDPSALRRTWVVTPDDRLCPYCAAVPGLNPQGVGLTQLFRTPLGPVSFPPLHPNCRCAVSGTIIQGG